jgi:hypothetical protein
LRSFHFGNFLLFAFFASGGTIAAKSPGRLVIRCNSRRFGGVLQPQRSSLHHAGVRYASASPPKGFSRQLFIFMVAYRGACFSNTTRPTSRRADMGAAASLVDMPYVCTARSAHYVAESMMPRAFKEARRSAYRLA